MLRESLRVRAMEKPWFPVVLSRLSGLHGHAVYKSAWFCVERRPEDVAAKVSRVRFEEVWLTVEVAKKRNCCRRLREGGFRSSVRRSDLAQLPLIGRHHIIVAAPNVTLLLSLLLHNVKSSACLTLLAVIRESHLRPSWLE